MLWSGGWTARLRGLSAFRLPPVPLDLPRLTLPRLTLPRLTPPRLTLPRPTPLRLTPLRLPKVALPRPAALAAGLAWAVAGIALFTVYLHFSRTAPANSDGASNALQAWQMLHGNPLLRGWELSDVSFYTTELPQYVLLEMLRGLTPDVIHVAAAMTYTLVVLGVALLAKGSATGRAGLARAVLAAGIMLAPQQNGGAYVLMGSPDHAGSTVPVLACWILLDRAPRRWWGPAAAGLLLTWGLVADNIVLITGVVPLAVAGGVRAYQAVIRDGRRPRAAWHELSLIAAALAAVVAAKEVLDLLAAAGGFYVWPVNDQIAAAGQLGGNLALTGQGLLLLFGANFLGHSAGYVATLAALHLTGIGLAGWAVCATVRRLPGARLADLALAAGVLLSLGAYVFGQNALDLHSTREFVAALPLGAALAGRVLAGRLRAARLTPALAVVATAYLLSLGRVMALPAVPAQGTQLAAWLAAQHLTYGLGGYWQANAVTLDSGGKIAVRALTADGPGLSRDHWETQPGWYNPARHQATFMVLSSAGPGATPADWTSRVRVTFGQPARVFNVGQYTILTWNKNLLADLRRSP